MLLQLRVAYTQKRVELLFRPVFMHFLLLQYLQSVGKNTDMAGFRIYDICMAGSINKGEADSPRSGMEVMLLR